MSSTIAFDGGAIEDSCPRQPGFHLAGFSRSLRLLEGIKGWTLLQQEYLQFCKIRGVSDSIPCGGCGVGGRIGSAHRDRLLIGREVTPQPATGQQQAEAQQIHRLQPAWNRQNGLAVWLHLFLPSLHSGGFPGHMLPPRHALRCRYLD